VADVWRLDARSSLHVAPRTRRAQRKSRTASAITHVQDTNAEVRGCRYKEDGRDLPVYQERIVEMVQANKQTLEVDFIQLSKHQTALAIWAIDAPTQMFELFNEVARESVEEKFEKYIEHVHSDIFVRMTGLPVIEPVRNIRCAFRLCAVHEVPRGELRVRSLSGSLSNAAQRILQQRRTFFPQVLCARPAASLSWSARLGCCHVW
jgi:MCM N-terminal domain